MVCRALQTREDHKRKGYASLIVKALSRKLAVEHNRPVFTTIIAANQASGKMFKKLGFEEYSTVAWTRISKEKEQ